MLEVMRDYLKVDSKKMFREIQSMRHKVEKELEKKHINYDKLKSALVPSHDKKEIALVFDSTKINDGWYGLQIMNQIIPLFDKKSNHSVLEGDYLDRKGKDELLFKAFKNAVILRKSITYRRATQFYIVYINNLSDELMKRFDRELKSCISYVGFADMTFGSTFKTYLSTMLVHTFIKHEKIIIQGHEPDRNPKEDVNMIGYPFEDSGYTCRSINSDLKDLLLYYKIERPMFKGFETDTEFSLNAITTSPKSLKEFQVEVEEAKLNYIKNEKSGSMKRAGLEAITTKQLSKLIKQKIEGSYIYNLGVVAISGTVKFNIIIEIQEKISRKPYRLLAALEYQSAKNKLRLITFY